MVTFFSISVGFRIVIVKSSKFCVHFLLCFLLFSVIEFPFSLIPAYFVGVMTVMVGSSGGVCYHSLNISEIDEFTVGKMKHETSHFTRFITSVSFVSVILGHMDTNSKICSSASSSFVSSPR